MSHDVLAAPSYSTVYLAQTLTQHDGDDRGGELRGTLVAILDARSRARSATQLVELVDAALKALDARLSQDDKASP